MVNGWHHGDDAKLDIATSILSLSAPGPEIVPDLGDAPALAKHFNEWAALASKRDPSRLGFFAAVPGLYDTEGAWPRSETPWTTYMPMVPASSHLMAESTWATLPSSPSGKS